jgi:hypothetical protein
MRSKHAIAKTKKSILGVLLCFALFAHTTPIAPAQQDQQLTTPADEQLRLQTEFETQLMEVYQQAGSQQEVIAEATRMVEDMALEATVFEPEYDPIFFDPWGGDFPEIGDGSDTWRRKQQCLSAKLEECRRTYNAELFSSAAVATTIFAGCLALTAGSAFVLCVAAAAAAHVLNIAAAKQRYQACVTRAKYECQNV